MMTEHKPHSDAATIAVRAHGKGLAVSIRKFVGDAFQRRQQRLLHQQAADELKNLPLEVQRDLGWPERFFPDRFFNDKK